MKKIIFILGFTFLLNVQTYSQWIQQNSGTTTSLNDIKFINKNTGWICADGTLLKTTNGGNNWFFLNNPVPIKPLRSIIAIDSSIIYCVGNFETIIKSTNGGTSWTIIKKWSFWRWGFIL